MKLIEKMKNFLTPKKSETKQQTKTPEPVSQPAKAKTPTPQKIDLPEPSLAESAEKEKDRSIKIPYHLDENEIYHPSEEIKESVIIPEGITFIPEKAFKGKPVKSIQLPESLLWIGEEAFSETALEEIILPSSLQFLQKKTFADCKNLRKVILSSGLLGIGKDVFKGCPLLTSIDIPESVCYLDADYSSSPDINWELRKSFQATTQRLHAVSKQTTYSVPKSAKEKINFIGFLFEFQYSKSTELPKEFPEWLKGYNFLELGNIKIYRTIDGRKILSILEELPIFDSGDARYDSYKKIYLFRSSDGNSLSAISTHGGYELASVTSYENIFPANEKTKYLLDIFELL